MQYFMDLRQAMNLHVYVFLILKNMYLYCDIILCVYHMFFKSHRKEKSIWWSSHRRWLNNVIQRIWSNWVIAIFKHFEEGVGMPKKRSKGTNIQGGVQQCFYVRVVRKGSDETKLRTTEIRHRSTIWIQDSKKYFSLRGVLIIGENQR